jgi:hypothetical protein
VSTLTVTATVTDATGAVGTASATCTIGDAFVLGITKPTAANTGLGVLGLTPQDLTVVNGDLNITPAYMASNGNSLDRVLVKGHVVFTGTAPFTISNSIIQGRTFSTAGSPPRGAIVYARSASTPATALLHLTNCEIFPIQPDVNIVCVSGERVGNLYRCNIYRGSDLVNYWGSRADVQGCYLHDFSFWDDDEKHKLDGSRPWWSHNDGIQSNGCVGAVIVGNNINMTADPDCGAYAVLAAAFPGGCWGSGVMLTGSVGYIEDALVRLNWFGGGQAPVCMPFQSSGAFEDGGCSWEVSGNRWYSFPDPYGTNQRQFIRWGYPKGPGPASVFGNVFTSDTAIPVALRGTVLPTAVLVGSANNSGQYIVRVNA